MQIVALFLLSIPNREPLSKYQASTSLEKGMFRMLCAKDLCLYASIEKLRGSEASRIV